MKTINYREMIGRENPATGELKALVLLSNKLAHDLDIVLVPLDSSVDVKTKQIIDKLFLLHEQINAQIEVLATEEDRRHPFFRLNRRAKVGKHIWGLYGEKT